MKISKLIESLIKIKKISGDINFDEALVTEDNISFSNFVFHEAGYNDFNYPLKELEHISFQTEPINYEKKWMWQHTAINYINEGKTVDEAVEIANRKYNVNFDESLLAR
jgi:hypothetical protein